MPNLEAKQFYSHYCCYSSCHESDYGSATLIAPLNTHFNYSSIINEQYEEIPIGAQFDIKSSEIQCESNINSTNGKSHYSSILEHRRVSNSFIRFQTIVYNFGGFITVFNDVNNKVDISYYNIINSTLYNDLENNAISGIIHIRHNSIAVSNSFVVGLGSTFPGNLISFQNGQTSINATITDSFIDSQFSLIGCNTNNITIISIDDIISNITTYPISQLFLGDCQGKLGKSPPPIDYVDQQITSTKKFDQTNIFTPTELITFSTIMSTDFESSFVNNYASGFESMNSDTSLTTLESFQTNQVISLTRSICFTYIKTVTNKPSYTLTNTISYILINDKYVQTNVESLIQYQIPYLIFSLSSS